MNTVWWDVKLTTGAKKDFAEIIRWTKQNFGTRQVRIYEATLEDALDALHAGPAIIGVKQRDDLGPGIHTLHVARNGRKGRHFIVFRANNDRVIDVLRILYDGMALATHLPS